MVILIGGKGMQDGAMGHARRPPLPPMDRLGELCISGRDSAQYLWQVPTDENVRAELGRKLVEIRSECEKQSRREMNRIITELETADERDSQSATGRDPAGWVRPAGQALAVRQVGPDVTRWTQSEDEANPAVFSLTARRVPYH